MTDKLVIFSTCGSREEADRLARLLLEGHLAACVNLVPQMQSVYWWQGRIEQAEEILLMIKTSRDKFEAVSQCLSGAHSYEIPEVLALPVVDGAPNYLSWLDAELRGEPSK